MITLSADTHKQGSAEWLMARAGACTASRFSDAIGMVGGLDAKQSAYVNAIMRGLTEKAAMAEAGYKAPPKSTTVQRALDGLPTEEPSDVARKYAWLIALEQIAGLPLDDTFVTWAMRRGQELEPEARAIYESRMGQWVDEVSLILTDDRRFGYSADGFVGTEGLIEIKCPSAPDKIGGAWAAPEFAHLEYIDQINGGLWITGRKWCDLVIYCPWLKSVGKDLFVKRIFRDDDAIEKLETGLIGFWRLVEANLAVLRAAPLTSDTGADDVTPPWAEEAAPLAAAAARISAPTELPLSIF